MPAVPLNNGIGELMAPQTLVTCIMASPDGAISIEPGALHGRSAVESSVRMAASKDQVPQPQLFWCVWTAIELDAAHAPLRYRGLAASELWIDSSAKLGFKVLAEQVNRISEAIRGGVNLKSIGPQVRAAIAQELETLAPEAWKRSGLNESLARGA